MGKVIAISHRERIVIFDSLETNLGVLAVWQLLPRRSSPGFDGNGNIFGWLACNLCACVGDLLSICVDGGNTKDR
jgi:hypothetical protein